MEHIYYSIASMIIFVVIVGLVLLLEMRKLEKVWHLGALILLVWSLYLFIFGIVVIFVYWVINYPNNITFNITVLEWWYLSCILFIAAVWNIFLSSPQLLWGLRIPSLATFLDDNSTLRTGKATDKEYAKKAQTVAYPLSIVAVVLTILLTLSLDTAAPDTQATQQNSPVTYIAVLKYLAVLFSFLSLASLLLSIEILDTLANPFTIRNNQNRDTPNRKLFFYRKIPFLPFPVGVGAIGLVYFTYATLSVAAVSIMSFVFYKHLALLACLFLIIFGLPYLFGYYEFKIRNRKEVVELTPEERLKPGFKLLVGFYLTFFVIIQVVLYTYCCIRMCK